MHICFPKGTNKALTIWRKRWRAVSNGRLLPVCPVCKSPSWNPRELTRKLFGISRSVNINVTRRHNLFLKHVLHGVGRVSTRWGRAANQHVSRSGRAGAHRPAGSGWTQELRGKLGFWGKASSLQTPVFHQTETGLFSYEWGNKCVMIS